MAQQVANPWSFTNADQATSVAITSIANNGASALVTTSGAHGLLANAPISIQGTTITGWRGGYKIQAVPSTTTFLIALPDYKQTLANNGANGNVLSAAYLDMIRAEQMLWDANSATTSLLLTDINGNIVWNPTPTAANDQPTSAKVWWIRGLVLNTIPATSVIQITVN
jgi:hypothetical protein